MIVAGFGFRASADISALRAALEHAQIGHPPVTALAAPHDKRTLPAELAAAMGLPFHAICTEALEAVTTPTRSLASVATRRTGSVAEAAALAAAGPGARLLVTRQISPDRLATCAIAEESSS